MTQEGNKELGKHLNRICYDPESGQSIKKIFYYKEETFRVVVVDCDRDLAFLWLPPSQLCKSSYGRG